MMIGEFSEKPKMVELPITFAEYLSFFDIYALKNKGYIVELLKKMDEIYLKVNNNG